MKKLNKKGFTLIELLAVIVILAIIMVLVLPNALGTISTTKVSAFETAVDSVRTYLQSSYEYQQFGVGNIAGYDSGLTFSTSVNKISGNALKKAGYDTTEIKEVGYKVNSTSNRVEITCATVGTGSNFAQSSKTGYTACS